MIVPVKPASPSATQQIVRKVISVDPSQLMQKADRHVLDKKPNIVKTDDGFDEISKQQTFDVPVIKYRLLDNEYVKIAVRGYVVPDKPNRRIVRICKALQTYGMPEVFTLDQLKNVVTWNTFILKYKPKDDDATSYHKLLEEMTALNIITAVVEDPNK